MVDSWKKGTRSPLGSWPTTSALCSGETLTVQLCSLHLNCKDKRKQELLLPLLNQNTAACQDGPNTRWIQQLWQGDQSRERVG